MTTFALVAYLIGLALGLVVRLPVLAAVIFGLVLAALATGAASVIGLAIDFPSVWRLIAAAVLIQMGYATAIFLRGWRASQRRDGEPYANRQRHTDEG